MEEKEMRPLLIAALAASVLALPACATRQVDTTPPTVTYAYNNESDYRDIEGRADQYCADKYNANAVVVGQVATDGGYKATFACK
jgi:hypothetical protein